MEGCLTLGPSPQPFLPSTGEREPEPDRPTFPDRHPDSPMTTPLSELHWESHFVSRFPGDPERRNFTRAVRNVLYSEVRPTPVRAPRLVGWADRLAADLGLAKPAAEAGPPSDSPSSQSSRSGAPDVPVDVASLELLAGNRVLPAMRPYAARYGGHQFGQWAGQLGDGRALTLGEATFAGTPSPAGSPPLGRSPFPGNGRLEFQLKGAGPTPYSRRADGRAVLRSSLREFLCSEAMHALGVPTTRALSLVATGEPVVRDMFYDGNPEAEPGAVVCRVAPSFLRFGNFEILAAYEEHDLLKKLADFVVADFYPELDAADPDVYGRLLDEVCRRTAEMVVHWQRVGFVHGVMNTDNMSILGLTIDYGPYGWLEPYDPTWTPNTTDAGQGRYRFGYQPAICRWNLGRLASALFPLVKDEDRLHQSLGVFTDTFRAASNAMVAAKLGLSSVEADADAALVEEMYALLGAAETDYTLFFRGLSGWRVKAGGPDAGAGSDGGSGGEGGSGGGAAAANPVAFHRLVAPAFYADEVDPALRARWGGWAARYAERAGREPATDAERAAAMRRVNPKYVPRNYLAQNAIAAAEQGDTTVLERLTRVLQRPYDEQPGEDDLAARRPEWARRAPGCSALSCSS
jgi:uncharacterized protein YdiU (UPF0061 family)